MNYDNKGCFIRSGCSRRWFCSIYWAGLLVLVFSFASPAERRPDANPPAGSGVTHVLFVGNSYTHGAFEPLVSYNRDAITDVNGSGYGGVAGMFKQLTESAGLKYDVTIEAVSGKELSWHVTNRAELIFQPKWDKVFLQDHSRGAIPSGRDGNRTDFQAAVIALKQGIHVANPDAEIYLYETFPRSGLTYVEGKPYFGEPIETMGTDVRQGYFGMLDIEPGIHAVSPAGSAWVLAIQQDVADRNPYDGIDDGKINLWADDNHHASKYGCYLNAVVHFGAATGIDPRTLGYEKTAADLGIASNVVRRLQQVAFEALSKTHDNAPSYAP